MMGAKSYAEQLKDPRWQRKRLEILNRDNWTCQNCHSVDKTLHVDHQRYEGRKPPWEVDNDFLQTLCEDCHRRITLLRRYIQEGIGLLDEGELLVVQGFVTGQLMLRSPTMRVKIDYAEEAQGIAAAAGVFSGAVECMAKAAGGRFTAEALVELCNTDGLRRGAGP